MKRILNQLIKLYPNKYVTISKEHTLGKHSHIDKITDDGVMYRIYIADSNLFNGNCSTNGFKTIKVLDKYLSAIIDNYKPIYKT
jgi:hypothetical protein